MGWFSKKMPETTRHRVWDHEKMKYRWVSLQEKERIEAEEKKKEAERQRKLDNKLRDALDEWHEKKRELANYDPGVDVYEYASGPFLCHGGIEIPCHYIESIEVCASGGKPRIHVTRFGGLDLSRSVTRNKAAIKITMASGQHHIVECESFEVDILLDRLRSAWKNCGV